MGVPLDPRSAAAAQRSRTQAPSWRDSAVALVRGGALQLQLHPPIRPQPHAAPSRLLSPPQKSRSNHIPFPSSPRSPSPEVCFSRRKLPPSPEEYAMRIPAALRDRLALTRRLDDTLKQDCLERLDEIGKSEPSVSGRRPSWLADDLPRVDLSKAYMAGGDSSLSERSDVSSLQGYGGSGNGGGVAGCAVASSSEGAQSRLARAVGGASGFASPSASQARRRQEPPWMIDDRMLVIGSQPDVWRVTDRMPDPRAQTLPRGAAAAVTVWGSGLDATTTGVAASADGALPPRGTVREDSNEPMSGQSFSRSAATQMSRSRSAPSLQANTNAAAAVAAAKEANGGEKQAARGANSFLRTSLRYALQV
eukprot:TRINITY_DN60920_c0_g1_i1.p1 TRINITY_DN60920_c0_g1~~TRINITY_DN60920_c0_g1_i1.p1  ORF type:complete len:364 (-),score=48.47 TRINITY_DN60920_c0_g1_i1:296-1387(-)